MSTPKQLSFQKMFISWFDNIVATYDVQEKQDLDWDWEEEILKFIKDPETEYLFMEAESRFRIELLNLQKKPQTHR